MTNTEAIEKLERQKIMVCHGCVHPSMVGWCEDHCQLPKAFDMAINALTAQPEKRTEERTKTHECDYISRQAAIDAIKTWGLIDGLSEGQAIEILADEEKLPFAQPEILAHGEGELSAQPEIIRCKECKHWREGTVYSYCGKLYGMGVLDIYDYMTTEDDYCSMAERLTDG